MVVGGLTHLTPPYSFTHSVSVLRATDLPGLRLQPVISAHSEYTVLTPNLSATQWQTPNSNFPLQVRENPFTCIATQFSHFSSHASHSLNSFRRGSRALIYSSAVKAIRLDSAFLWLQLEGYSGNHSPQLEWPLWNARGTDTSRSTKPIDPITQESANYQCRPDIGSGAALFYSF